MAERASAVIVGSSSAMRDVSQLIERVSGSDASVLIQGETGTGKDLVARAIHTRSRRKAGPFVAINCADGKTDRKGLFVQAKGGTLFLDGIGELPLDMHPKLLRALQERKGSSGGRECRDPVRLEDSVCVQSRSRGGGRREAVPRRPVLSHQCREDRRATASRPR